MVVYGLRPVPLDCVRLDSCFECALDGFARNSVPSICSESNMVQEERLIFDVFCLLAINLFHGVSLFPYLFVLPLTIRRLRGQESDCQQITG